MVRVWLVAIVLLAGCAGPLARGPPASSSAPSTLTSPGLETGPSSTDLPPADCAFVCEDCEGRPVSANGSGDRSVEEFSLNVTAEGPVRMKVAFWEYPPEVTAGTWTSVLSFEGVERTEFQQEGNESWLLVEAAGPFRLHGCVERSTNSGYTEHYMVGHWSMTGVDGSFGRAMPYDLEQGAPARAVMHYAAKSSACNGMGEYSGDLAVGRHDADSFMGFGCT